MEPRKTRKAWNIPHQAHALTFSVRGRQPFLLLPGVPEAFLRGLDVARNNLGFELWAYVVMPEHVHLVVCPRDEDYRMEILLTEIKRPASKEIFRLHPHLRQGCRVERKGRPEEYRFWQDGGGYDRNLFTAREAWEKIDYTHDNPRRRGLVEDAVDWPWTSVGAYREREVPIAVDLCLWEG